MSKGAAVSRIRLFAVTEPERLVQKLNLPPKGLPHRRLFWRTDHYQVALVDGWKLQVNERPPGTTWLFDLANDPTEQTNLADREPERVAALKRLLAEHTGQTV